MADGSKKNAKTTKPSAGGGAAGLVSSAVGALALYRASRHIADRPAEVVAAEETLAELATVPEPEGGPKRLLWNFDRFQRERPALAFPIAVVRKFGNDKAGYLAALVAYFGFFSIFPLMIAFVSVLGFVVPDPDDQREFAEKVGEQIPVVGTTIVDTAGRLDGSTLAVVVGIVLAVWSGLKMIDAMQNAMNSVWDVPPFSRPSMAERRFRSLLALLWIGGGLVASIVASNLARLLDVIPGLGRFAIWAASAGVSILIFLVSYQILTDRKLRWRDLVPGAVFGGVAWWALQTFGAPLIQAQKDNETYGDYAAIIALMFFFFLAAQLSILGAEISVVRARGLWPRSVFPNDFTPADIEAFELAAEGTRLDEGYTVRLAPTRDTLALHAEQGRSDE